MVCGKHTNTPGFSEDKEGNNNEEDESFKDEERKHYMLVLSFLHCLKWSIQHKNHDHC